jgi:ribonuclease P/MRP protein subunit POP1
VEKVENNKYQVYPIYNLISPHGLATHLLRRFVYLQSRLIGLSEFNHYLSDTTKLIFPNDYPSTESYRKYRESKTNSKLSKYCKYPASKRVNFQKIGNPYPFYAAWHRLEIESPESNKLKPVNHPPSYSSFLHPNVEIVQDLSNKTTIIKQFQIQNIGDPSIKNFLIPVLIEMTGKGTISYNSLICLPTIDDLSSYRDIITSGVNSSNFVPKILSACQQSEGLELVSVYRSS